MAAVAETSPPSRAVHLTLSDEALPTPSAFWDCERVLLVFCPPIAHSPRLPPATAAVVAAAAATRTRSTGVTRQRFCFSIAFSFEMQLPWPPTSASQAGKMPTLQPSRDESNI